MKANGVFLVRCLEPRMKPRMRVVAPVGQKIVPISPFAVLLGDSGTLRMSSLASICEAVPGHLPVLDRKDRIRTMGAWMDVPASHRMLPQASIRRMPHVFAVCETSISGHFATPA